MAQPTILEEFLIKLTVQGPNSGEVRDAEAGFESLRLGIASLTAAFTAAAAGTVAVIKTFADSLTETFYAAQKLGSTTEHVTALGDAAERAGGSVAGIREDLDALVAKMRASPAFKDWLKTNLKLSAADMATPESILVASSKALGAMRQTDPQHYKALRDYIGTSEATILAVMRPEFDAAYKQQKDFVKGLDGIALKSKELHNDWIAATTHFKEALELVSGPFVTAMDDAIKRTDAWLTEKRPAIEAFANSTAQTVADIISKLGAIPFGRIADELFDGLQKGLAKINFENVKTVLHEFMNWLVTGPLADKIRELVVRVGAGASGIVEGIGHALAPGMGPVQAPGAPGSGGRFGHAGSTVGRASNDAATGDGRAITGVGTAAPLTPAAGREGQIAGVDKRLMDSLAAGAAHLPAGYRVEPFSGYSPTHGSAGSKHRLGEAVDVSIIGPDGKAIPNRGADTTGMYRRLARYTYGEMLKRYPELAPRFAHGAQFGTTRGSGVPDLMHYDIGGQRRSPGSQFSPVIQELGPIEDKQSRLELHDIHSKLVAIAAAYPHARHNIAMLTGGKSLGSRGKPSLSRHDGTRNQTVNIEIASTDPHSAASEIARQMHGLQSHTLREWKVA
ncbi:MAG TPA: hypothetical protein VGP28_00495 [Methylocella sp.]|jgi:hypothetical protein|nr:hypothetical protein [Methylocella sp.]